MLIFEWIVILLPTCCIVFLCYSHAHTGPLPKHRDIVFLFCSSYSYSYSIILLRLLIAIICACQIVKYYYHITNKVIHRWKKCAPKPRMHPITNHRNERNTTSCWLNHYYTSWRQYVTVFKSCGGRKVTPWRTYIGRVTVPHFTADVPMEQYIIRLCKEAILILLIGYQKQPVLHLLRCDTSYLVISSTCPSWIQFKPNRRNHFYNSFCYSFCVMAVILTLAWIDRLQEWFRLRTRKLWSIAIFCKGRHQLW